MKQQKIKEKFSSTPFSYAKLIAAKITGGVRKYSTLWRSQNRLDFYFN
jgi:hypothetical protein